MSRASVLTWSRAVALVLVGSAAMPVAAMDTSLYLSVIGKVRDNLLQAGFRTSYAIGDFNGDLVNDLAIGIPYATVGDARAAGKVIVIYGDIDGLMTPGRPAATVVEYSQAAPAGPRKMPGNNEPGDLVGFSLAAGDFNYDQVDDLAVGAPGEDLPGAADAGVVFIAHGHAGSGLDFTDPGQAYRADGTGQFDLAGEVETGALLGFSLAAGDFNDDNRSDLAIGEPGKNISYQGSNAVDAGAVVVAHGTDLGIDGTTYDDIFHQHPSSSRYHLGGRPEKNDLVGFSLAAGSFNGDGFCDLAIGVPGENSNAGLVNVAKGNALGLDADSIDVGWYMGGSGRFDLPGAEQKNALVGFSLAAGDFNGDGRADLAIGAPGRTVSGHANAGAVFVARGDDDLVAGHSLLNGMYYAAEFSQSGSGNYDLPGGAETGDLVGFALAAGDFNWTAEFPRDDLAISAPGENDGAGAVMVRYGSGTGGLASSAAPRLFMQSRPAAADDLFGTSEANDLVGLSLGAGRFGLDEPAELVIAAPGERLENPEVLDVPLPAPNNQTLVDGFTSVIFGEPTTGPNAAVERNTSFRRFEEGVFVPAATMKTNVEAAIDARLLAIENGSPISINLYRGGVSYGIRLDPSAEDDILDPSCTVWLELDLLPDPSVRVKTHVRFSPVEGGVDARVAFDVAGLPGITIRGSQTTTIPVLPILAPVEVTLLPDMSLEVIYTLNPV